MNKIQGEKNVHANVQFVSKYKRSTYKSYVRRAITLNRSKASPKLGVQA